MKKFILLTLFCILLTTNAYSGQYTAYDLQIKDTNGADVSAYALTSGVAVNSEKIYVKDNVGFASLLLTVDASGDVDVYAEYSFDGTNFYRPYISAMDGTATIEGNIINAASNTTRLYVFTPRLAEFMRIVFDPDANSTITAKLIYQKDR